MNALSSFALIFAVGCVEIPVAVEAEPEPSGVVDVALLRSGTLSPGTLTIGPLSITSPLAEDGLTVFAQDPVNGLGVELLTGESIDAWPPPIGTPIRVRGYYAGPSTAPVVWVLSARDVAVLGPVAPPVVLSGSADPLPLSLARWEDVAIMTEPDPAGRAELSVRRSTDGRFGRFVPGAGNTGDLTGILLEDGSIAPRSEVDWDGTVEPSPIADLTIAAILAGGAEPGANVRFDGLQTTSWSRGGRWSVLQDQDGLGLWVDVEGWAPFPVEVGQVGKYVGQVQVRGGTWVLRTWAAPTWSDLTATPIVTDDVVHGALIDREVAGLSPPDLLGERMISGGIALDDRFIPLDQVADGDVVRGVVDTSDGTVRLAVLTITPPPEP